MTDSEEIIEEIVHIPVNSFETNFHWKHDTIYTLEGVLTYKESISSAPAALIPGPHPNFAGTMDNNVTVQLSKALAEAGWITLRYNYPGIGASDLNLDWVESQGLPPSAWEYWNYVEKELIFDLAEETVHSAHHFLKTNLENIITRISWIGYSFGALLSLRLACKEFPPGKESVYPDKIIAVATPWLPKHGFDFISNLQTPTLAISGSQDFALDRKLLNHALSNLGPTNPFTLKILENQDHFFRGSENLLISEILSWIQ